MLTSAIVAYYATSLYKTGYGSKSIEKCGLNDTFFKIAPDFGLSECVKRMKS